MITPMLQNCVSDTSRNRSRICHFEVSIIREGIGSLPPGGGATLRTLTLLGGGLTPLAFSSTL